MGKTKESLNRIKEFIELWRKFNQIYKEAMNNKAITEEEEELFLETKSMVARKFQGLVDSMAIERAAIDRTYDVINQIISLRSVSALSEEALRRIDNDWHQSYISLNRLLGHLETQGSNDHGSGKAAFKRSYLFILRTAVYLIVVLVFVMVILFLAHILGVLK